jgi:hypothetical protein
MTYYKYRLTSYDGYDGYFTSRKAAAKELSKIRPNHPGPYTLSRPVNGYWRIIAHIEYHRIVNEYYVRKYVFLYMEPGRTMVLHPDGSLKPIPKGWFA